MILNETDFQHNSWKKLVVLQVTSVFLCLSVLFSMFTPFPLAMGNIIYGRQKALITGVISAVIVSILSVYVFKDISLLTFFLYSLSVSFIISEAFHRGWSPMKGVVRSGIVIVSLIVVLAGMAMMSTQKPVKETLTDWVASYKVEMEQKLSEANSRDKDEILKAFAKPETLANEILKQAPNYIFAGTFFSLWINFLLILRGLKVPLLIKKYPYGENDLMSFKVPEYLVWLLILGMGFYLAGIKLSWGETYERIGLFTMYSMGVFYFFQGVGIYTRFLNFIRISGFLKTFMLIITVVSLNKYLALAGVLDVWVNFDRFFNRQKDQGE